MCTTSSSTKAQPSSNGRKDESPAQSKEHANEKPNVTAGHIGKAPMEAWLASEDDRVILERKPQNWDDLVGKDDLAAEIESLQQKDNST